MIYMCRKTCCSITMRGRMRRIPACAFPDQASGRCSSSRNAVYRRNQEKRNNEFMKKIKNLSQILAFSSGTREKVGMRAQPLINTALTPTLSRSQRGRGVDSIFLMIPLLLALPLRAENAGSAAAGAEESRLRAAPRQCDSTRSAFPQRRRAGGETGRLFRKEACDSCSRLLHLSDAVHRNPHGSGARAILPMHFQAGTDYNIVTVSFDLRTERSAISLWRKNKCMSRATAAPSEKKAWEFSDRG